MPLKNKSQADKQVWEDFVLKFSLDEKQQEQFLSYASYLITENKKFNITAITDFQSIIKDHFTDALSLAQVVDLSQSKSFIDVGSGGGLPGIPLKILYPHLHAVLIEVNQKKATFLQEVSEMLGLVDVEVCDQDWRGFVRGYEQTPDYVIARASLSVEELQRMFKGSSSLKDATLVYWASKYWNATKKEAEFLDNQVDYYVDQKLRRLFFFKGKIRV